MKLTDKEREHYANCLAHGKTITGDEQIKLLSSEQAAWQEVDRLREENEQLKSSMSIIEFDNDQEYQDFIQYANSKEKTRTPEMERLRESLKKHRQKKEKSLEQLKSQLDDAVNTLGWYADEFQYLQDYVLHGDDERDGYWESPAVMDDKGERAQQAIQRIKGEGTE